jgi:hypothetical protein
MKWRLQINTKDRWNKKLVLCIDKQDWQTLSHTNKKREKTQISEVIDEKGVLHQLSLKSTGSLGHILKTYPQDVGKSRRNG